MLLACIVLNKYNSHTFSFELLSYYPVKLSIVNLMQVQNLFYSQQLQLLILWAINL